MHPTRYDVISVTVVEDEKPARNICSPVGPAPDLSGCVLYAANLRFADLRGANFSNANLKGADFTGSDLSGADM